MVENNGMVRGGMQLNSTTQDIMGKYGLQTPQTQTVAKQYIPTVREKVKIHNNTTNIVNNVPANIGGPIQGRGIQFREPTEDLGKFKHWANKAFQKQNEETQKRKREFIRREQIINKSSKRLSEKLADFAKKITDKLDPRRLGETVGGQLKLILQLFGIAFIAKNTGKILDGISSLQQWISQLSGWARGGQKPEFIDNIKTWFGNLIFGKDYKPEDGLLKSLAKIFWDKDGKDGIFNYVFDQVRDFFKARTELIAQIPKPEEGGSVQDRLINALKYAIKALSVLFEGEEALKVVPEQNVVDAAAHYQNVELDNYSGYERTYGKSKITFDNDVLNIKQNTNFNVGYNGSAGIFTSIGYDPGRGQEGHAKFRINAAYASGSRKGEVISGQDRIVSPEVVDNLTNNLKVQPRQLQYIQDGKLYYAPGENNVISGASDWATSSQFNAIYQQLNLLISTKREGNLSALWEDIRRFDRAVKEKGNNVRSKLGTTKGEGFVVVGYEALEGIKRLCGKSGQYDSLNDIKMTDFQVIYRPKTIDELRAEHFTGELIDKDLQTLIGLLIDKNINDVTNTAGMIFGSIAMCLGPWGVAIGAIGWLAGTLICNPYIEGIQLVEQEIRRASNAENIKWKWDLLNPEEKDLMWALYGAYLTTFDIPDKRRILRSEKQITPEDLTGKEDMGTFRVVLLSESNWLEIKQLIFKGVSTQGALNADGTLDEVDLNDLRNGTYLLEHLKELNPRIDKNSSVTDFEAGVNLAIEHPNTVAPTSTTPIGTTDNSAPTATSVSTTPTATATATPSEDAPSSTIASGTTIPTGTTSSSTPTPRAGEPYGQATITVTQQQDQGDAQINQAGLESWVNCVSTMGKWYQANVHTYQNCYDIRHQENRHRRRYACSLMNGATVFDDCSAFVWACLQYFGVQPGYITTAKMQPGSKYDQAVQEAGFQYMPYNKSILIPGDIICGGPETHTEIWAGDNKSWSWGFIHDGINGHEGMPCRFSSRTSYRHIWRYVGPGKVVPTDWSNCIFGDIDSDDSLDRGSFGPISRMIGMAKELFSEIWKESKKYVTTAANGQITEFVGTSNWLNNISGTYPRENLDRRKVLSNSTRQLLARYSGEVDPTKTGLAYLQNLGLETDNPVTNLILSKFFNDQGGFVINEDDLDPELKEKVINMREILEQGNALKIRDLELSAAGLDHVIEERQNSTTATLRAIRALQTDPVPRAASHNN